MIAVEGFFGEYRWLSNFYPARVVIEGWEFPSSEHAYQAAKSLDPNDWQVIQTLNAGQAKRYGRKLNVRPDWEDIKLDVMQMILAAKFQDPRLRAKLIETDQMELVEVNNWNDRFWGVSYGTGHNHLGKLLMELRANLIKEHQK